jgi:hypothetical protein
VPLPPLGGPDGAVGPMLALPDIDSMAMGLL